jgi:hypothetical protein
MKLGQAEVEALASSFAGSLTSLHLGSAKLRATFWRPLAQHFPNLQQLCLEKCVTAKPRDLAEYLAMSSRSAPPGLDVKIAPNILTQQASAWLKARVDAQGLQHIRLWLWPSGEHQGGEEEEGVDDDEEEEEHSED